MLSRNNESISKIINGTKGVGEEQAWVGTAEVNEQVLNDFTKARLRRISNHINYVLFPFLVRYGYPLADCTYEWVLEEKANKLADTEDEKNQPVNRLLAQKKKFPGKGLKLDIAAAKTDIILNNWLRRFFEKGGSGIDFELWKLNFESLINAADSAGISYAAEYKYAELATALRENAAVFFGFQKP